jgi:hypothetical protein
MSCWADTPGRAWVLARGPPGYGFRRLLVSSEGKPKQLLADGERKSIAADRVTLVPGPTREAEQVQDIFRLFTAKKLGLEASSGP